MTSLAQRALASEQMDDPHLDPAIYAQVLADLSAVNNWTLARRPTLGFVRRALREKQSFRLLDVGFGQGDMLRSIARWASHNGIKADLVGVDLNPRSAAIARAATPETLWIDFRTGDYAVQDGPFDLIISSLVAHHMTVDELVSFLRFMEDRAALGWMVNDLHRHRAAHRLYPTLARVMGWHRIVREDGTLSIARSFRPDEWPPLLRAADVDPRTAQVCRRFPFRLCVERLR